MTDTEIRSKIVGIFQQSARGDLSVGVKDDIYTFYQTESGEIFLKLTKQQMMDHTANEILDMLGATL